MAEEPRGESDKKPESIDYPEKGVIQPHHAAAAVQTGKMIPYIMGAGAVAIIAAIVVLFIGPLTVERIAATVPMVMILISLIGCGVMLFGIWMIWLNVQGATKFSGSVSGHKVGAATFTVEDVMPGLIVLAIGVSRQA